MAESKKVVNFTPEQTVELVGAYKLATSDAARKGVVTAYAAKFGKTEASIRMKLVREEVYVKPETAKVSKTGEPVTSKDDLADAIAKFIPNAVEADVTSLAKANKRVLTALLKIVADLSEFKAKAMEAFEASAETSDVPETE